MCSRSVNWIGRYGLRGGQSVGAGAVAGGDALFELVVRERGLDERERAGVHREHLRVPRVARDLRGGA